MGQYKETRKLGGYVALATGVALVAAAIISRQTTLVGRFGRTINEVVTGKPYKESIRFGRATASDLGLEAEDRDFEFRIAIDGSFGFAFPWFRNQSVVVSVTGESTETELSKAEVDALESFIGINNIQEFNGRSKNHSVLGAGILLDAVTIGLLCGGVLIISRPYARETDPKNNPILPPGK